MVDKIVVIAVQTSRFVITPRPPDSRKTIVNKGPINPVPRSDQIRPRSDPERLLTDEVRRKFSDYLQELLQRQ